MDYPISNGVDIKLPPEISLPELSRCTKDLNTIFSVCPIFKNFDGAITLSSVDVGSVWLNFIISGTAISLFIAAIAKLVDCAMIIRSHYLTTREQTEKLRSLEIKNDILEQQQNINNTVSTALLNNVSAQLADEYDITDPEDIERLKNAIQLLSDWMSKGMEIYASVQAPDETKAIFPPIETQKISANDIALLTTETEKSE